MKPLSLPDIKCYTGILSERRIKTQAKGQTDKLPYIEETGIISKHFGAGSPVFVYTHIFPPPTPKCSNYEADAFENVEERQKV